MNTFITNFSLSETGLDKKLADEICNLYMDSESDQGLKEVSFLTTKAALIATKRNVQEL